MKQVTMEQYIENIRGLLKESLSKTSLGRVLQEHRSLVGAGKMLRSRLGMILAAPSITPLSDHYHTLVHSAAAIEMLHAASLLHDDVIDGGELRRKEAAFWVSKGTSGAILLGDLFLCLSIELICDTADGRLTSRFISKAREMCDAESEQELLLRNIDGNWNDCMSLARRKTGCLFAFMGIAAGWPDQRKMRVFEESAYDIGTAYQLADDILDGLSDEAISGKTAGTDRKRGKLTATSEAFASGHSPVSVIEQLCRQSIERLTDYPDSQASLVEFIEQDLKPILASFTSQSVS
jgi:geranylgeranyl pyrophosphate synthase